MTTKVASVDYPNKRIYLSAATVGVPLDTLDVYRDVRALRRVTEAHRAYRPMIVAGGNIQKTPTTYTAPYVRMLYEVATSSRTTRRLCSSSAIRSPMMDGPASARASTGRACLRRWTSTLPWIRLRCGR